MRREANSLKIRDIPSLEIAFLAIQTRLLRKTRHTGEQMTEPSTTHAGAACWQRLTSQEISHRQMAYHRNRESSLGLAQHFHGPRLRRTSPGPNPASCDPAEMRIKHGRTPTPASIHYAHIMYLRDARKTHTDTRSGRDIRGSY